MTDNPTANQSVGAVSILETYREFLGDRFALLLAASPVNNSRRLAGQVTDIGLSQKDRRGVVSVPYVSITESPCFNVTLKDNLSLFRKLEQNEAGYTVIKSNIKDYLHSCKDWVLAICWDGKITEKCFKGFGTLWEEGEIAFQLTTVEEKRCQTN